MVLWWCCVDGTHSYIICISHTCLVMNVLIIKIISMLKCWFIRHVCLHVSPVFVCMQPHPMQTASRHCTICVIKIAIAHYIKKCLIQCRRDSEFKRKRSAAISRMKKLRDFQWNEKKESSSRSDCSATFNIDR